jgi:hypothetical protein
MNVKVNLLLQDYLIELGTKNENTCKDNKRDLENNYRKPYLSTVTNATGEIPYKQCNALLVREVRGFIVNFKLKEAKSRLSINRAYSTSSKETNHMYSVSSKNYENNLGFEEIARL